MATQAQSQGRYAVVNTLLDTTDVTLIDSLSGRQGDNGRIVYFAIKDGNLPHNLDGQNVVLTAKDSAGKVKQISGVHDMISATGGLFSMLIPGEMYQSAGDIEEAYISVQDGAGTVISSIPVTFTVLANNILFTANASKDYIDSVQQAINEANSRISGLNDNIKAQQLAYETLKTSVENLNAQIDSKQVALLNVANHFTDTATFDKGITAKTISTPNFKSDGTSIQQSRDGNTWHNLADDDGVVHNSGNDTISGDKSFTGNTTLSNIKTSSINTGSITANGLKADFREFATGVEVWFNGNFTGDASFSWHDLGQVPSNITKPFSFVTAVMGGRGGVSGASSQTDMLLMVRIDNTGKIQYQLRHGVENNLTDYKGIVFYVEGSTSYFK
ncbi:BppU family phage baseplate upper protein [Weissella confusa]|uniref:BppU family phage baseplate upper protein n=1 Tax=Weissella confusa TaxID=1583 RepID=UPI0022E74FEB|nr:BppU family phage baseplate upper protein [Weissella confusa]